MLRRIHLHGSLAKIHPGPIEVFAETVAEALKSISMQLPGFRPDPINGRKRVQVLGFDTVESLVTPSDTQDIHVYPQFNGGKNGGFVQIGIGALLIAASFAATAFDMPFLGSVLLKVGIMLIIGGLLQLLQQPKRDDKDKEQRKSHYLSGQQNTVEIGTRIGILYGRRRIGGHYLSFQVSSNGAI